MQTISKLKMFLMEDGLKCAFEIHSDDKLPAQVVLEAPELDDFIAGIGHARAAITDPVTARIEPGARLLSILDPAWSAAATALPPGRQDGVLLALRHPGFGWLGFVLPQQEASRLGEILTVLSKQQTLQLSSSLPKFSQAASK